MNGGRRVWLQRELKLQEHLQSLQNLDTLLEELLAWLAGLENTLLTLEAEPLPEDIPTIQTLIQDHKEFMENTALRQSEVRASRVLLAIICTFSVFITINKAVQMFPYNLFYHQLAVCSNPNIMIKLTLERWFPDGFWTSQNCSWPKKIT